MDAEKRKQLISIFDTFTAPLSEAETEKLVKEYSDGTPEKDKQIREFAQRKASDMAIAERAEKLLFDPTVVSVADREKLEFALGLLHRPITSSLLTGHFSAFSNLTLAQRIAVLRSWSVSALEMKRMLYRQLKALCFKFFFSVTQVDSMGQRLNPNWAAIGYPGPDPER